VSLILLRNTIRVPESVFSRTIFLGTLPLYSGGFVAFEVNLDWWYDQVLKESSC
jgi:hypothetical protein